MKGGLRLLVALAAPGLLPQAAAACSTCISSAFGDPTYHWAYLGLMAAPFVVGASIAGVLARVHVARRRDRASATDPMLNEETT